MLQLDVIELRPMENKMVVLDAPALSIGLQRGQNRPFTAFASISTKRKFVPISKPQLDEIAALLKDSAELKGDDRRPYRRQGWICLQPGTVGASGRRGGRCTGLPICVDTRRLTAVGAGMAAPVATNRTAEGRAANCRVEIVELF